MISSENLMYIQVASCVQGITPKQITVQKIQNHIYVLSALF